MLDAYIRRFTLTAHSTYSILLTVTQPCQSLGSLSYIRYLRIWEYRNNLT